MPDEHTETAINSLIFYLTSTCECYWFQL